MLCLAEWDHVVVMQQCMYAQAMDEVQFQV